jgi:hypothetical protein
MGGFRAVEDRPTPKEVYNWRLYSEAIIIAFGSLLYVETHYPGNDVRNANYEIADSVMTPPLLEQLSPVQALKTTLVSPLRMQAPFQAILRLHSKLVLSLVLSFVTSVRTSPLYNLGSEPDSNEP